MAGCELNIVINRPIEEVFGFLTNLENDAKWWREWVDVKNTSEGPVGIDTRVSLSGELFDRRIANAK